MKKTLTILFVLIILLGMVACSTNGETDEVESTNNTDGEDYTYNVDYWASLSPDDPVTWNAPNNYKRIGMVVPDGTNEFYVAMTRNVGTIIEAEGYEFVWTGASDAESAINTIDTWVTQGVDALIVLVQDKACEDAVLRAMKEGVLVVLGSTELASYHVWCNQDYYTIGWDVAEMAAADMKEQFGDNAAYIIAGNTSVEFMTLKTNGLTDGMAELYPNGTAYINNNSSDVQGDVEALLIQHPEIKAVISWHNNYTIPAIAALNTLNMNKPGEFAVYGSQMVEQTLSEIKDPNSCYVSDTWMGDQGRQYANVVLTLLNGGTVNHNDYAPDFVVNADNAETYYEDYYAEFGDTYIYG